MDLRPKILFKKYNIQQAADEDFPSCLVSRNQNVGPEFNVSKWDWIMDHQYQRLLMQGSLSQMKSDRVSLRES